MASGDTNRSNVYDIKGRVRHHTLEADTIKWEGSGSGRGGGGIKRE